MTSFLHSIYNYWRTLEEKGDERSRGWFLTGSPIPVIILLIVYYRFVKKTGPEFMKNRKPFNIDKIIIIYNLMQVLLCGWLSYESFRYTFGPKGHYNWTCQPIDKSKSPLAYRIASFTWMYYMLKFFDLLDTVFFVLRKKFNQISFLHVYHHVGIIILGYIATKYYPDGQGFLLVPMNCFIHIFMYAYYFISNFNPDYKRNIWWKKYITQMQILQFLILTVQSGKIFFMPDCEYPRFPLMVFLPQNVLITILFINFYRNAYLKSKSS